MRYAVPRYMNASVGAHIDWLHVAPSERSYEYVHSN